MLVWLYDIDLPSPVLCSVHSYLTESVNSILSVTLGHYGGNFG